MEGTPEDECPVGTMPEATEEEDNHDVEHPAADAHTAAAERDVEIVAKPSGKGNVPSPPELGDVPSEIRMRKVSLQANAEKLRTSNRDI